MSTANGGNAMRTVQSCGDGVGGRHRPLRTTAAVVVGRGVHLGVLDRVVPTKQRQFVRQLLVAGGLHFVLTLQRLQLALKSMRPLGRVDHNEQWWLGEAGSNARRSSYAP